MKVYLNGNEYELAKGTSVNRTPLEEWADNIRLDGQQQRKDRRLLSSWAIDSWASGLGIHEINTALTPHLSSIWDAENTDTRIDGQIPLSPAFNTCTIVPSRGDIADLHIDHMNNLYFVESTRYGSLGAGGNMNIAFAYQFSAPLTLGSFRTIGQVYGSQTPFAGSITGLMSIDGGIEITFYGGDYNEAVAQRGNNRSGRIPTIGGFVSGTAIASINSSMGTLPITSINHFRMGDLGGAVYKLAYTSSIGKYGFWQGNTQVATIGGNIGSAMPPLVSDGVTMYAQLPVGIYNFDAAPNIVVDTSRAQDRNGMQTIFRGNLFFKNKKSWIQYDGTDTFGRGYDEQQGLVAEKFGEITAACSSWKWQYIAVKGGTYSHILTMDSNYKWQYYAKVPTPGLWVRELFLSDSPDGIDRLWLIYGNFGYPGYFLNPMVNPLQAATYSFVPTGEFQPGRYDGGLAEVPAGWFDQTVVGDAVSAVNPITCFYGLDGAEAVTTLGVISSTTQSLTFGSPAGLQGYRIQPRYMLTGESSGTTPVLRKAILHYLKDPTKRYQYEFTVDLTETAKSPVRPLEDVIGSLNFESNSKTLMPFWYGQIGTRYVKVISMPGIENVENQKIYEGERTGQVRVIAAEIV